jgi:hypothetical protein
MDALILATFTDLSQAGNSDNPAGAHRSGLETASKVSHCGTRHRELARKLAEKHHRWCIPASAGYPETYCFQ